jgi:pilus assembly protein CpaC
MSAPSAPAAVPAAAVAAAKQSAEPTMAAAPVHTAAIGAPAPAMMSTPLASAPAGPGDDRTLRVAAGRSLTLESAVPVSRVSVSNPAIAEPIAISPTQLLINGLAPGITSLVLWPKQGQPIMHDVVVHLDTAALTEQMRAIFPHENVQVQASKDSLVLSGPVSSPQVAEKMVALAGDYSAKIVNHMDGPSQSRRQVLLKVKFAEVSKQALTELGAVLHHVDPTNPRAFDRGSAGTGEFAPPAGNLLNDPVGPELTWTDAINLSFFEKSLDLGMFITALKSRGLFQELAEPNLIAADGQEASFLAGGEFPVPIAQPGANFVSVTIEWKKFGISLNFKPTIRPDGTIVLRVLPEVSSLDFSNAILLSGFRIPSLIVRRAETEVELSSGQAFAIAGLYDRNLLQTKSKIPVLGDIPLLGYLFRSKNLQKNQAELLVIVTPVLVEPLRSVDEVKIPEMPESFEMGKPGSKY